MEITQLLHAWQHGDMSARDKIFHLLYQELRLIARKHMNLERSSHTLGTAGLVNEAYMRLLGQDRADWKNRAQFFGVASQAMRRVLLDYARERKAEKRGGGAVFIPLAEVEESIGGFDFLGLDEAMNDLAVFDERMAKIVELKFFAGLPVDEIAEVMGLSPATIHREWSLAKSWLHRRISRGE